MVFASPSPSLTSTRRNRTMADILLPGTRFGRLVVLHHNGGRHVFIRCDCGTERDVLRNNLVRGASKSCGCTRYKNMGDSRRTHGKTGSRLYRIWRLMRARCTRSSHPDWKYYGGRGIAVCKSWEIYPDFQD